ncbi:MAG: neutral/alkaline non-lysosomal ceramidase N-terminal domain-containing protein [candidate division KSB1 bacterium]|nr:neutral/alkaline non-lysosomal ceramidase N-terminal domain-containing protein [candidate division KSB1 bacterium]
MKKWLLRIGGVFLLLLVAVLFWIGYNVRDRHPGYSKNLSIDPPQTPAPIKAGFAARKITPQVPDTWTDADGDAKFHPEKGDTWQDGNRNGKFDGVWIAGFHNNRPAAGIHDDLWARAMVLDDGQTRIALVVLDAIGFLHDDVIEVRNRIPAELQVDYTIVCSTHDHEAPDLIGIWGPKILKSGVDPAYREMVIEQAAGAVVDAVQRLRPAKLRFAQDLESGKAWVQDSRRPYVLDPGIRVMHAVDAEADTTLGVLINWANHPETLWSDNLYITSDFPHYIRKFVEEGIKKDGKTVLEGLGGVAVYVNGAIGGLMTTKPEFGIRDPFADTTYAGATFEKARAQGAQVARVVFNLLKRTDLPTIHEGGIRLQARTIFIPMKNPNFRLAAALGVLDRGFSGWIKLRSEVSAWTIGPASFVTIPGEIYPEIVNGGIEAPPGQDFEIEPLEVPPIREMMPGEFRFVFGLANDEIGYIIPRSEWDEKPPYLYNASSSPYGEVNSLGADAAPVIHSAVKALLRELSSEGEAITAKGKDE